MRRIVLTLCAAEGLTLIGVFAFPALMPTFRVAWGLSNAEAGWIAGIYFLGYALAVPVLTSLTDRIDAKLVFMAGTAVCTLATGGFALAAQGLVSAMALRFLGGVGLAGVYMPGLKALVDRVSGPGQARAIALYTASFSLGTMLSFMVVGEAAARLGWHWAFALAAIASLAALVMAAGLAPVASRTDRPAGSLLDFRPVLRNRAAMGYILGYTCHMWELFTFRSWVVAFLAFVQGRAASAPGWSPTSVATVSALVAMAASLGGADLALRFDRRRVCSLSMLVSGGTALLFGFAALLPYWVAAVAAVVYSGLIQIDSAALTTGAMMEAKEGRQGATVALHSLVGFSAAFFGPLTQGAVLDFAGGGGSAWSWGIAFATTGIIALLGPLALRKGRVPSQ